MNLPEQAAPFQTDMKISILILLPSPAKQGQEERPPLMAATQWKHPSSDHPDGKKGLLPQPRRNLKQSDP